MIPQGTRFSQLILVTFLTIFSAQSLVAADFQTKAKQVIVVDYQTGAVLFEKNSDKLMVPSSMTKVLTAYVAFKMIQEGKIALEDTLLISEKAWRKGGSKMFVELGSQVPLSELLKGILVVSGNDACIAVAEGLAGTEAAFARMMNETAHAMGAQTVNFLNASGWPDEGHVCTAKDLAIIAYRTIRDFPQLYKMNEIREFTHNGITQRNRNPLFDTLIEADGLKTGHTNAGGYGLVASAINNNGRRLIMVVNGLKSEKERKTESLRLMQYGFRAFDTVKVCSHGQHMAKADVWMGQEPTVNLIAPKDQWVAIETHEQSKLKVRIEYTSPIEAPIKAGQVVANLVVTGTDVQKDVIVPLMAEKDVPKAGFFKRIWNAIYYSVLGTNPVEEPLPAKPELSVKAAPAADPFK